MADITDKAQRIAGNLAARGHAAAAEVMRSLVDMVQGQAAALDGALVRVRETEALERTIKGLQQQIGELQKTVDAERLATKRAAIPMDEARSIARSETRAVLQPYLEGEPTVRMLAMTIKNDLDARWGKEGKA